MVELNTAPYPPRAQPEAVEHVSASPVAAGPAVLSGLSVVVPAYNSERSLATLIERLEPVLRDLSPRFEAILVNDGSRDGTWRVIKSLTARYPWVRGVDLMRNHGQENAILCGIRLAQFGLIVTIDDDLQHPPEEIPTLLEKLGDEFDVVYGNAIKERHSVFRNLAAGLTRMVLRRAMGGTVAAPRVTAFKVFRTELREAFSDYRSAYVSIDVLLTWGTQRFGSVDVRHDSRREGASNYTFSKLLVHAVTLISGSSVVPLQAASLLGIVFLIVALVTLICAAVIAFTAASKYCSVLLICGIVTLVSGVQILILGIIGEYLARLYVRSTDRPPYIVRSLTRQPEDF